MKAAAGVVAAGAILASGAWKAALPPPPVSDRGLPASVVGDGAYPRAIVDPLGRTVSLAARPRRIVSLALSDDEILLALVAPARIAGLTYLIDDPESTPSAPLAPRGAARVSEENTEPLLALRPDLALAAGYTHAEAVGVLEAAGVPVVGTGAHATLDDVIAAVRIVGLAVDEAASAAALAASLEARIARVEARPTASVRPRVLVWDGGFTYGAGTMPDDVIRRAGGVDAASEAGIRGAVALTDEAALALRADMVLVPIAGGEPRLHAVEALGDAPVWRAVTAVRRGEVYGLPRAWIGSVSLPAVRALEALAAILDARGA